jgi:SAM-dependent methyltransferase
MSAVLHIAEQVIRQNMPRQPLLVCWKQWRAEQRLKERGVRFRQCDPDQVEAAYTAMPTEDFHAINGRQEWANWRTIPRALSGQVPNRPLRIVDLGCGAGASTRVLAYYAPAGSSILGLELSANLVELARRRTYRHQSGVPVPVTFACQGVTLPFHDADQQPLPDGSIDLVNASGIVGHHLTTANTLDLIDQICQVLTHDGLAVLDVGPTMSARTLQGLMKQAGFAFLGRYRSWVFDPCGQIAFRRTRSA